MKIAHNLAIRVLCLPKEVDDVSISLKLLLGCGKEKEIAISTTEPPEGATSVLVQSSLKKESDINHLVKFIANNLNTEEKKQIFQEAESRVDEHLDFFLRFDKDEWMQNKKLKLTTKGNCFHLTFAMAAYPKSKGKVVALVKEIFKTMH